jgi:hypothetical protein
MLDTTKYSVGELRDLLVNQYGLDRTEAENLTPKSAVVAKLHEYESDDAVLDTAEVVEDKLEVGPETATRTHNIEDRDWTQHVLSLMYPDELVEGAPTVDGLRRIADKLMGPISSVTSKVLQSPDLNNNFHSTVRVRVVTPDQVIDGCADAGTNNCKPDYARYPVAMAESRAESRAYRKLLRLRNVISAEETVKEDSIIDQFETINTAQISTIDRICSKLDINVEKFLEKCNIKLGEFTRLNKTVGTELCEKLNSLRQSGEVSDDIKGYSFNWRV